MTRQEALSGAASAVPDERADAVLVSNTRTAMERKLARKRAEGRHGWWDPAVCSEDDLLAMLNDRLLDNDWLDVAIFAAMLRQRRLEAGRR